MPTISIRRFLSGRGIAVLASELRWVLLPSLVFAIGALLLHRSRRAQRS